MLMYHISTFKLDEKWALKGNKSNKVALSGSYNASFNIIWSSTT